jgi:tetratricopeptide (TPR) repeat protein
MDGSQPVPPGPPQSDGARPAQAAALGDAEIPWLKQELKRGELAGLREYLARTRKECDWQDRVFVLSEVTPGIRLAALDFACDTEPEAADLFLIRCAYYSALAWTMRGSGTCDQIAEGRFRNAAECVQAALTDSQKAALADPQDPTVYACVLPALRIFGQLQAYQQQAFQQAVTLAPDLVPAYQEVTKSLAKRWYGESHEESLRFARHAMANAGPGSDMAVCLFQAHDLVRTHFIHFDKSPKEAERYLHDPEARRELNSAFDSWTQPPYAPRRSSIPYLREAAEWYYRVEDAAHLKRVLELLGNAFSEEPWSWIGDARRVYARALQIAEGKAPPPISGKRELWEDAVGVVSHGVKAIDAGKFLEAGVSLTVALGLAHRAPEEESRYLIPLVFLNKSLLCLKQRKNDDSTKLREKGTALLEACRDHTASQQVQRPLANALYKLGDYHRAAGFLELAIGPSEEETDPFIMAEMLHKLGACYNQMGLKDQATVPLRAALAIYEANPQDPRIPGTLVNLGNSLRKSSPPEAETYYKRAAELHVAQLQYETACPAWVNLGVLCSEQGRQAEALDYYRRVLRVREQTPGMAPDRIAGVLNNMANCLRRMGSFAEANAAVDRALKLHSANDATLPNAYGTKALIYMESGEDEKGVEWMRKALAAREKQPSPDHDLTVEDLEAEIAALKRLGRDKEVAIAEEKLASVHAKVRSMRGVGDKLGAMKTQMEGAVFLELPFGNSSIRSEGRRSKTFLADMLSEEVRANGVGYYGGWVVVPENTTLFFYGPDAERLYQVLEPSFRNEPACAGARVQIRQGSMHREVVMPRRATTVN